MATVTETRQGWEVTATITGATREEVEAAVKAYYARYPYAGYGTSGGVQYLQQNGEWKAYLSRARSAG